MAIKMEISDVTNMNPIEREFLRFVLGESDKIEAAKVQVCGPAAPPKIELSAELRDAIAQNASGNATPPAPPAFAPVVADTPPPAASAEMPPQTAPPAPPAPAAPVAPPAATAVGVVSITHDSRGLPWDGRIHSATRSKLANGEWRGKRGVDEAETTRVEAELRAAMAVATAPAAPAAPAAQTATELLTFQDFMAWLTPLLKDRRVTEMQVREVISKYDVAHPGIFLTVPETQRHLPAVKTDIEKLIGGAA